jgi:hypothetical protein
LLQHAYLGEDVEVVEFVGFLFLAKGVSSGRFRDILSAGVFIKDVGSVIALALSRQCAMVNSYVKPLCDDTCFSSAKPICASLSDGCGLRHSDSNSYTVVSS